MQYVEVKFAAPNIFRLKIVVYLIVLFRNYFIRGDTI